MTNLDGVPEKRDITLLAKVYIVRAMVFQESCMGVKVGLLRKLNAEELTLSNCGVGRRVPWTERR